ncbi:immunity repressor [Gordonia phage VanLee]|uniref:Immunity repressor n=1 Tax=Gordonia phage VanLee TaxID=2845816 RepID=A0A8F2D9E3_9CAUD|nr:immunity repressor [Gordonia phage VanLee]QWS68152.1 immunity repressor [Gordonia phage VanLee]
MDTVLISAEALGECMKRRGFSTRALAHAVESRLIRDHRAGDPDPTCSKSTISNLRCGERRHCRPDRAAAIESILGLEPYQLFRPVIRADRWYIENVKAAV